MTEPPFDNAQAVTLAADLIAMGLSDAARVRSAWPSLTDADIDLAEALALSRTPHEIWTIPAGLVEDGAAAKIAVLATALANYWTTPELIEAACLADRADKADLLRMIVRRARGELAERSTRRNEGWETDAPPRPLFLAGDGGGVLPSPGAAPHSEQSPTGPTGASPACLQSKHTPGPIDGFGRAECLACGTTLICVLPGEAIDHHTGDYVAPVHF